MRKTALTRGAVVLGLAALTIGLAVAIPTSESARAVLPSAGLVAHYPLTETSGTIAHDTSGNNRDATILGGSATTLATTGVTLAGTSASYIALPNNLGAGLTDTTVSIWVNLAAAQPSAYFITALGNPVVDSSGTGYFGFLGNATTRATISSNIWSGEQSVAATTALPRSTWKLLTFTQSGSTGTLYIDGTQVSQSTTMTNKIGTIGGGVTTANYLGRSVYSGDGYMKGSLKDFRLYNRALTADEVSRLFEGDTTLVSSVTATGLASPGIIDENNATVMLPVSPGTSLASLAPTLGLHASATVSPASGSTHDFSSPVQYVVTGTRGDVRTWTVSAQIVQAPAVIGAVSDPTVIKVDSTYWMYATTSAGIAAYSSPDLVTWQPLGTVLAVAAVPWARSGLAAPAIAQKNGAFLLYYGAATAGVYYADVVGIGVATATTPTGPFSAAASAIATPGAFPAQFGTPSVVTDANGTGYLVYGDNATDAYHSRSLYAAELTAGMTALTGTSITLAAPGYTSGASAFVRGGVSYVAWVEKTTAGSTIWYSRGTAISGALSAPAVLMADAKGTGITGVGNPTFVEKDGSWFIAYDRDSTATGTARHEIALERLVFTSNADLSQIVPSLSGIG